MKLLNTQTIGSRVVEFYETAEGVEVFCLVAGNISRAFPPKVYKKQTAAERYAARFFAA